MSDRLKINRRTFIGTSLVTGSLIAAGVSPAFAVNKSDVDAAKARLEAMENEMDLAVDEYNRANEAYVAATQAVEDAKVKIDECQKVIDSKQGYLSNRATTMYKQGGPISYLGVLLGVSSFGDFATLWDTLNNLNQEDAETVAITKASRKELQEAKVTLEEQEAVAKQELNAAAAQKSEVEAQEARYQAEYNSLSNEYKEAIESQRAAAAQQAQQASRSYTPPASSGSSSSSSGGGGTPAPSIPTHGSVVDYAASRLGCPYLWGAAGPNSFDCSGLVMWCYAHVGISLPHYTEDQLACASARFDPSACAPGDVLYRPGHVAISTGGTNYIHAPHTGAVVSYGSGGRWTYGLRF
ncbi:MAG: NlpC/P60 family protein [Coriobacteriales bacterium]|nr:NlpC/P60 family protein [Coriobacteriales bacterium]